MPTVEVSNIGCWRWTGTASVTTNSTAGYTTVESATATFDRYRLPGSMPEDLVGVDAFKSTNSGTANFTINGLIGINCTITGTGTGPLQGDGGFFADAGFIASFRLPDPRLNRTAVGSGGTDIPYSTTTTCPGNPPETNSGRQTDRWFLLPEEGAVFSADGLNLVGQKQTTDSDGTKTSFWIFRALREE
ncbi:MAG: hypothetical protein ABJC07_07940 [Acidobacteriota bacterium]